MVQLRIKSKKTLRYLLPAGADILLNLRCLKKMDKSQFGEEKLLLQYLKKDLALNWPKLYLEIGAAYPIYLSNSYALSKLKFKGISYDADKKYSLQWKLFRRNDELITKAVIASNEEDQVIFHKYPSSHSPLSTTSDTQNAHWQGLYKVKSKEKIVKALDIQAVYMDFIKSYDEPPTILMLDVEGIDEILIMKLLNNLEHHLFPKLILIECNESVMRLDNPLNKFYELYGTAGLSLLLSLK